LTSRLLSIALGCVALGRPAPPAAQTAESGQFRIVFAAAGITSLTRPGDPAAVEYISRGRTLGSLLIRYRLGSEQVREFSTADPSIRRRQSGDSRERIVVYNESGWNDFSADLELTERFRLDGDAFYWTVHLRNLTHKPLELEDVLLPGVIDHVMERFMVGHEWYPYWRQARSSAPYLLMMPVTLCPPFEPAGAERSFAPARFESFDAAGLFLHSAFTMPGRFSTAAILAPESPGDELTYVFKFCWVADLAALQKALSAEGLLSDANGIPE
jgi:hypothetical protein